MNLIWVWFGHDQNWDEIKTKDHRGTNNGLVAQGIKHLKKHIFVVLAYTQMAEMQKRLGCKSEDMNMKCLKMDMNVPLEAECTIYLVIDDSKCRQIYL